MGHLERLGIRPFLNAHDTITLYGGSRMAENTLEAMGEIAGCFVEVQELQRILGAHIARLTRNEGAYITNCAAGGIQLAAAVCLAKGDPYRYRHLPKVPDGRNEILVLHAQHNCYGKSIEAAGGVVRLVGDADEALAFDLEASLTDRVAALFYFPNALYERGSLPLETVCEIAHGKGIPVVVDAAAQLPPVENLWNFAKAGADLVIFSGGKTLCGPQDSGLIVGKKRYIEDCLRFGAPEHGICRGSKVSRESMIGLTVAIENYLATDHAAHGAALSRMVDRLVQTMEESGKVKPWRVERGSVGQSYPRAFGQMQTSAGVAALRDNLRAQGVFIGADERLKQIYFSVLNLTEAECETVCLRLKEALASL
ncbi:MAG: aminotransferase class V-fold PLP-dependent enzyme [Candidatus Limiplasma sp.]|nr:aminotransferase class V-fold PLP-dependent enzyme [Candidatus Limiplasma sp.]